MKRYGGNLDFLQGLPLDFAFDIVKSALESIEDEETLNIYLQSNSMLFGITYEQFKNNIKTQKNSKSANQILEDLEKEMEGMSWH